MGTITKGKQIEGNVAMLVARLFSGLNINAFRYLLPVWLLPITGVSARAGFACAIYWIISIFIKEQKTTARQKWQMLGLGAVFIFGYYYMHLLGIQGNTPVTSAVFSSLQPLMVFLIVVIFMHAKVTWIKVAGLLIGFGGACLCIFSGSSGAEAGMGNTWQGSFFNFMASVWFSIFLVLNKKLLKEVSTFTMMKYAFTGAAIPAVIVTLLTPGHSRMFADGLFHAPTEPMLILLFTMVFATAASYLLIPFAEKYLSATVVSLYNYYMLIVTTVASFILGQDKFSWMQIVAILMICVSVYLVEIADSGKTPKPATPANTGKQQ